MLLAHCKMTKCNLHDSQHQTQQDLFRKLTAVAFVTFLQLSYAFFKEDVLAKIKANDITVIYASTTRAYRHQTYARDSINDITVSAGFFAITLSC